MPALGDGFAMLKWITSFPGNPARGLPTVMGVVVLSDAQTSEPVALLDARSVTALRTGAVAAVAARALAREGARDVGIIGCGLHGAWAARCLAADGLRPGRLPRPARRARPRARRGARRAGAASLADALACDVVRCVTPGSEPVVDAGDLRPGMHLNMLGADGPGKAEATIDAVAACALFCDEWAQAAHGGELTGAVEAGLVTRERRHRPRRGARRRGAAAAAGAEAVTLFDSTGLAIQDLAIAAAALRRLARGAGAGDHRRALMTGRCPLARSPFVVGTKATLTKETTPCSTHC